MWRWRIIFILSGIATAAGTVGGFFWGFGSRAVYDLGLPGGQISLVSAILSSILVAAIGLGAGIFASGGAIAAIAAFGRKPRMGEVPRAAVAACGAGLAAFTFLSFVYRDASYVNHSWGLATVAMVVTTAAFAAILIVCHVSSPEGRAGRRAGFSN